MSIMTLVECRTELGAYVYMHSICIENGFYIWIDR